MHDTYAGAPAKVAAKDVSPLVPSSVGNGGAAVLQKGVPIGAEHVRSPFLCGAL